MRKISVANLIILWFNIKNHVDQRDNLLRLLWIHPNVTGNADRLFSSLTSIF